MNIIKMLSLSMSPPNSENSEFIDDISVGGIREKISELKFTPKYEKMKLAAESSNTDISL